MASSKVFSQVPFSEPPWLSGFPSPYYTESHRKWQKACREYISENLTQYALEWERAELVPEHVFRKFAKDNMLLGALPGPLPVEWLKRLGINDVLGCVNVEDWDYTHTAIYIAEVR